MYPSCFISYRCCTGCREWCVLGRGGNDRLREELENSIRMQENHEEDLEKFPVGSLVKEKIERHEYYYIVMRENGKVKFVYKGKKVSEENHKNEAFEFT